jgi:enamine deaminase RidA (YjgF/YER057c/UK114 family)
MRSLSFAIVAASPKPAKVSVSIPLAELLGESARHARSAIGVAELPRDAAVEIEFVVTYAP